jgi:hypothetical protein
MKLSSRISMLAAAVVLVSGACGASPTASPTAEPTTTPTEVSSGEGCENGPAGTVPLINQDHGYCLRYTEGFEVSYPTKDDTALIGPVVEGGARALIYITVSAASGQTAQQIAEPVIEEASPLIPNLPVSEITFAGEPAVMIDGLPGQDVTRKVIVVHGERAYILSLSPWTKADPSFSLLEEAYNTIAATFEFH